VRKKAMRKEPGITDRIKVGTEEKRGIRNRRRVLEDQSLI
jgi:hypothetical protein